MANLLKYSLFYRILALLFLRPNSTFKRNTIWIKTFSIANIIHLSSNYFLNSQLAKILNTFVGRLEFYDWEIALSTLFE